MQYYGNLALRPERKPAEPAREQAKRSSPQPRKRQLPIGEKLMYLGAVALCVIIAGIVIYRYADLYQVNRQIQLTNSKYEQANLESKELQREVERLSDPEIIKQKALAMGLVPLDTHGITVTFGEEANSAVASR